MSESKRKELNKLLFALDPKVRESLDNIENYLTKRIPEEGVLTSIQSILKDLEKHIEENYSISGDWPISDEFTDERKKLCKFTLKTDQHETTLEAFQSPKGIIHEGKRPNLVVIDCYEEFTKEQLCKHIKYLEDLVSLMEPTL